MPDLLQHSGKVKTDLYCHDCQKNFLAQIDYDLNGMHVVHCPWCGHQHCRTVKDGRVTDDRWSSREERIDVDRRHVWKSDSVGVITSAAHIFLRERWLNRE